MILNLRTVSVAALMVSGLALSGCKLGGGGGVPPIAAPDLDPSPPMEGPFQASYAGTMQGNIYGDGDGQMVADTARPVSGTFQGDLTVDVNYTPQNNSGNGAEVIANATNFTGRARPDRDVDQNNGSDGFIDIEFDGELAGTGTVREGVTGVDFSMSGTLTPRPVGQQPSGSDIGDSAFVELQFDGTFLGEDREQLHGTFEGNATDVGPCPQAPDSSCGPEGIGGTFLLDKQDPK